MEMTLEEQFTDEMNFHKRVIVKRMYERMYGKIAEQKMLDIYKNDRPLFEKEYQRAWEILKDEVL